MSKLPRVGLPLEERRFNYPDTAPGPVEHAADVAGDITNPGKLLAKLLGHARRLEDLAELQYDALLRAEVARENKSAGRASWRSRAFSYAVATDGVLEIEFSNSSNICHFFISTVDLATPGRFYISLHKTMPQLGGLPTPGSWDYVGKLGGESLTFPVPDGMTRLYFQANQDCQGTLYVASFKSALPS